MAFDYGKKRVGIAVTDPLKIIATALETVDTKGVKSFVKSYTMQEDVECFVLGVPLNYAYAENSIMPEIVAFESWLKENFSNKKVFRIDERFTSKMAFQTIVESGVNKKTRRIKSNIDKVSATLILQTFMQKHLP